MRQHLDASIRTLVLEHGEDVFGRLVTKQLARGFLVIGNAVPFYERNKVPWRIPA